MLTKLDLVFTSLSLNSWSLKGPFRGACSTVRNNLLTLIRSNGSRNPVLFYHQRDNSTSLLINQGVDSLRIKLILSFVGVVNTNLPALFRTPLCCPVLGENQGYQQSKF